MKISNRSGIAAKAYDLALPYAQELGLKLWDVRFVKEGASWFLRFIIDKEDGVSIDDCSNLSRMVDAPLDEADFIAQSYYLEVSSPGLGREFTRASHFEEMMGKDIKIRLIRPRENVREFSGMLIGFSENIEIATKDGETLSFAQPEISWVKLDDDIIFN